MQEKKSLHWLHRHNVEVRTRKLGRSTLEQEEEFYVLVPLPEGPKKGQILGFNRKLEKCLRNIKIYQGKTHITTIPAASTNFIKPYKEKELLVDIHFFPNSTRNQIDSDYERVELTDAWQPIVSFKHPFLYDRNITGKIIKVSKKGMLVSLHLKNNDLFPNIEIQHLKLHIPSVGDLTCAVNIHDVFWISNYPTQVFINLKFLRTERVAVEMFGQMLILHGKQVDESVNIMELIRKADLFPKHIKKHLQFDYLITEEDYLKVLELRQLAYTSTGKIPKETQLASTADRYDDYSRIIICRHKGKIRGPAEIGIIQLRVTFCDTKDQKFELEESIKLPLQFQSRQELAEISRMCIHPDFQRTDLVVGLIERAFMYTLKTGKKYIITSCDNKMLRFYKMLGFTSSGITFELKTLNDVPHEFIYVKTKKGLTGIGMHPTVFFMVLSNIVKFNMGRSKNVRLTFYNLLWVRFNAWIGRMMYRFFGRRK